MEQWKHKNEQSRRREAYRRLFLGDNGEIKPDAQVILRDLKAFCRANGIIGYRTQQGTIDPLAMVNANGRREVWDRLMHFLHMPDRKVVELDLPRDDYYG
jgi:hypothetical protein